MKIEESAAFELYGKSFAEKAVVSFEVKRKQRAILSPEALEKRRIRYKKGACRLIAAQLKRILSLDCFAEDEKRADRINDLKAKPVEYTGGQYEIDFWQAKKARIARDYIKGVPHNYCLV